MNHIIQRNRQQSHRDRANEEGQQSSPRRPSTILRRGRRSTDVSSVGSREDETATNASLIDREGRLEEFMLYWNDYLDESSSGSTELLLAELELNRFCIKYLFKETQQLPQHQRPTRLLLNSCKYNPTDGTAQLLVKYMQSSSTCAQSLESVRLEGAYVGQLPAHTASTLLHGLPAVPCLKTVQLVDIDLRSDTVADKLSIFVHTSPMCHTLELRHCRVNEAAVSLVGRALQSDSTSLQRLTMHACVMHDAIWAEFCQAIMTDVETTVTMHGRQRLRHLSLPSNRLSAASLPNLTNFVSNQTQLESLDLQRMSRLFAQASWPVLSEDDQRTESPSGESLFRTNCLSFEQSVQGFCHALQRHACLKTLDLTNCGVTDHVADCLFQALQAPSLTTFSNGANGRAFPSLNELVLGGNELSNTAQWVTLVPHIQGLRRLDLPKLAIGRQSWYHHDVASTTNDSAVVNGSSTRGSTESTQPDCHNHDKDKDSQLTLFALCLQQNTSLLHLSHDGVPSQSAASWLKRNALLEKTRQHLAKSSFNQSSVPHLLQRCNSLEGSTARHVALQEMCMRQWI